MRIFWGMAVSLKLAMPVLAAVATIPGAFGKHMTVHLMEWVVGYGYDGTEVFQNIMPVDLLKIGPELTASCNRTDYKIQILEFLL